MRRKNVKLRIVPATEAKNNFGEIIRRVYELEEIQVVERAGLPVVGIVSISDLERLYPEKIKELPQMAAGVKRQRAAKQLREFLSRTGMTEYSDAEVEADVQRAVKEVRRGRPKKKSP